MKPIQLIAIQVKTKEIEEWIDAAPVIHEVNSTEEGLVIAKAISKQFDSPVRITYPSNLRLMECKTQEEIKNYISSLSGGYPNFNAL